MAKIDQESLFSGAGPELERLTAEVRSVVYENADNGWAVVRVVSRDEPGPFTCVGTLGKVTPGEMLLLCGRFSMHPKFGRQFAVEAFEQTFPATASGIIRYLSSGLIKGVGPKTAEALVGAFGEQVFDILDTDPDRLMTVKGITPKKLETILGCWREHRAIKNLMLFLQTHDVPTTFAAKIYKLFGDAAIDKLKENPYELAYVVRGIGFRTADLMAMRLGMPPDSQERMEAGLIYALFSLNEKGHVYSPQDELFEQTRRMLGTPEGQGVEDAALETALRTLEERKKVAVEELADYGLGTAVFLRHFYVMERETTARLADLVNHPAPSATLERVERDLPGLEKEAGLALSPEQRQAVLGACGHKVFIVTGGPGTGKTTITRMIVAALKRAGLRIRLAAPTGRAAKRLSESSGEQASTLHRLLQYAPEQGFGLREDNKLKADALIVDEASMLDVQLFMGVLRALPPTCRLILVGDVNQLPSVGPGNVLDDLLSSQCIPSLRLTHIYRQALESFIVVNAHRVNEGQFPTEDSHAQPPAKDFFWVKSDDPSKTQALIAQLVCERIPEIYGLDPSRDIQVLSPMHKGDAGTQALNAILQERLNPLARAGLELTRGRLTLRPGDRVLQLRNNYEKEVFNGDLGWVHDVDPENLEVSVDFEGRLVPFEASELDELTLAYAVSVHKSQGSEYPAVVVPVITQHYIMLQRNLLYTALTRARRLAVLIGSEKAVGMAVRNNKAEKRWTHLKYRLMDAFNAVM